MTNFSLKEFMEKQNFKNDTLPEKDLKRVYNNFVIQELPK